MRGNTIFIGGNDNNAIQGAVHQAWRGGYQQAVDALRELADEFGDEQTKVIVGQLADMLQRIKP